MVLSTRIKRRGLIKIGLTANRRTGVRIYRIRGHALGVGKHVFSFDSLLKLSVKQIVSPGAFLSRNIPLYALR